MEYRKELYRCWNSMKQRCYNTNNADYSNYGARGITVSDSWHCFDVFYADMSSSFKYGLTIERIDNDGGYSKENCKWACRKEQTDNRRNSRILEFNGMKMNICEWARYLDTTTGTLYKRMKKGFPIEDVLTPSKTPWLKGVNCRKSYG